MDAATSLRFLPGVGPARAAALAQAGLHDVWDLLHAGPRCLGPPPPLVESGAVPAASAVRLRARVLSARPVFGGGRGRGMGLEALLERTDGYALRARFFNAGYLRRHLLPGEWYLWEGRSDAEKAAVLLHPSFIHLKLGADEPPPVAAACRVAYRAIEGVSEATRVALVDAALDGALEQLADPAGSDDAGHRRALLALHRPESAAAYESGRRAFAARELLALAWRMQARRSAQVGLPGRAWRWDDAIHARALARLPFALTAGQEEALAALRADLRASQPMYRLLQGDVGSGKTALALLASLAVVADGAQALWCAPTAVLASQHHALAARCLAGTRVRTGLLTGGTPAAARAQLLADLAARRLDLLIGTHALLGEAVQAAELGLVVIDEQHKFGVAQRAALVNRAAQRQGWAPDLLLLTATPIPRTLALTAFGDLAVARIAGRPPGRSAVATELCRAAGAAQLAAPLRAAVAAGGQAYVICALREDASGAGDDDDAAPVADATSLQRALAKACPELATGLLHGALPERDKLALMAEFAAGRLHVLVATSVIEVGIDVAGATLIAVLDAERFGLAQLHQLRGRVGRGTLPGRCLICHRGADAPERLRILLASDDGLAIAEADLAARGPGALLGTAQHGALALRCADLVRDLDLLQDAHAEARRRSAAGEVMPAGLERLLAGGSGLLAGG